MILDGIAAVAAGLLGIGVAVGAFLGLAVSRQAEMEHLRTFVPAPAIPVVAPAGVVVQASA